MSKKKIAVVDQEVVFIAETLNLFEEQDMDEISNNGGLFVASDGSLWVVDTDSLDIFDATEKVTDVDNILKTLEDLSKQARIGLKRWNKHKNIHEPTIDPDGDTDDIVVLYISRLATDKEIKEWKNEMRPEVQERLEDRLAKAAPALLTFVRESRLLGVELKLSRDQIGQIEAYNERIRKEVSSKSELIIKL